jgi:putative nucleotidyltransferase with HDIG domain
MHSDAATIASPQFPLDELRAAASEAGAATSATEYLQRAVEQLSRLVGVERCSILLLRDARLHHAGSVGLPADFTEALDGSLVGPHEGTCGAAASRGRAVVTPDIRTDPKWAAYRELAEAAGVRSCWSVPLVLHEGDVLGTFATYGDEPGGPDAEQLDLAQAHASLVALGLDRLQREERLSESYEAVVVALSSALDVRDEYTGAHSTETAQMAVDVGRRLGLDADGLRELEQAALLHDIGKLGIPTEILHAPRPLTAEERVVMEQHPVIGERILRGIPYLRKVARAVRHEHERWDGGGYPDGLAGEAIPLASRVVLACDAWHAMTSDRPYRKALDPVTAQAELAANAGTQFDPRAVRAVLDVVALGQDRADPGPGPQEPAPGPEGEQAALLRSVAERTGADDLFVFHRTGPGHYSHFDGVGRGVGWAGNVELEAAEEEDFARAVESGHPVTLSWPDRGHVVGPYYARSAAIVPCDDDSVVVLGSWGDALASAPDAPLLSEARRATAASRAVPPAKRVADELEVLETVRAIAAISAGGVEGALDAVAAASARALSCEFAGVLARDDVGELRVGTADLGWSPPRADPLYELVGARRSLRPPLLVQDVEADDALAPVLAGTGATALHALEIGDVGVLFLVHAEPTPRGFTSLCCRVARTAADAAEVVIRRALAEERLAEAPS